jgi:hypothetical protein
MAIPVATPTGSLISIHSTRNGQVIPLQKAARDRGVVWPVVKSVGNAGVCIDAKAIEPRTRTILRFVNLQEDSAQGVHTWSDNDMQQHAVAALKAAAGRVNAQEWAAVDWFEPINEADPEGVAGWAAFGRYLGIMADVATGLGVRIAVPGTNRGTPEWAEAQALVASGCFAKLKAGGHIWTAHEGGDGPGSNSPISVGFGDRIPGAPVVPGAGSLCFRYRYLYSLLAAADQVIPLFISEFYLGRQGASPAELVERAAWYDHEASKDPFVIGFAPFTIDSIPPWEGEDVTHAYPAILDYVVSQRGRINGGGAPGPTPIPTPPPAAVWSPGVCLAGLHGRADGRNQAADFAAIDTSHVEAVLLLSSAAPQEAANLIAGGRFVLVRLFASFRGRRVSADDFARWMLGDMAPFYAAGVRYFQVHNEPNLFDEGLDSSWADGAGFAAWFMDVRSALKAKFPQAQFGFPGLSPGGEVVEVRADAAVFLQAAVVATAAADWVGVHCYWASAAEMASPGGGAGYLEFRRLFPNKLLFITEFANVAAATSQAERAGQYVAYYKSLRHVPNLGAAFAFVVSASDPAFAPSAWRTEQGALTAIPSLVGANMASIQSKPAPIQENEMSDADRATLNSVAAKLRSAADELESVARPAWWSTWPSGVITPSRKLKIPPAPIQVYRADGTPLPGITRQNAMDVFERQGGLLRVVDKPISGVLWWVQAKDVQPA